MKSLLRSLRLHCALAVLCLAGAESAMAQALRVEIRDSVTARPVVGVLVSAKDAGGQSRADALSNDSGTVTLRLGPGTYTISVRRIGVQPRQVPGVVVSASGAGMLAIRVANLKQVLPSVRVVASTTCGRAPEGEDRSGRLWEQISLALQSASITRRENLELPPLHVIERINILSPDLEEQSSVVTRDAQGVGRLVRADDPDSLAALGYVRSDDDGSTSFFAPDEQVLLSDAFLSTHCFSTPKRDQNSLLAELRFTPVRGRKVSDIEGTAYVDVSTGELRQITYQYVASRKLMPVRAEKAGGDVFLRRLPNGTWIVNKWSIRMPLLGYRTGMRELSLTGYREAAGIVQEVRRMLPKVQPPEP